MDVPGELRLVREATARLLVDVADLDDEDLAASSLLPDWSRADVLVHLTEDARSQASSPPAGAAVTATKPRDPTSANVVADLASASEYLADYWAVRPPEAWGRRLDHMRRGPSRITSEPAARLVEIVAHHVDLDLGGQPEDWPAEVVDVALAHVMVTLTQRHARVGGPSGVWRLTRSEGSGQDDWVVVRAPYGTEVHPVAGGGGDADATIAGPGHSLLAWLLGRRQLGHGDLVVTGDAELASTFPSTYPY